MKADIVCADMMYALPWMPPNYFHSVVTDPPYHLISTVKRFGNADVNDGTQTSERIRSRADGYARSASGFMGKTWDGGDIAFRVETWREVMRVMRPGAYLLAFGGTRTFHRMAVAIEDAGFEIRDIIMWLYGQGFPKSHNLQGEWEGFGTALKPSYEPIVVARKPLEGTIAQNVLKWGCGAMNIDGCRVEHVTVDDGNLALNPHLRATINGGNGGKVFPAEAERRVVVPNDLGRWPANVIHDGSDEVLEAFPDAPGQLAAARTDGVDQGNSVCGALKHITKNPLPRDRANRKDEASADRRYTEKGSTNFAAAPGQRRAPEASAARFFYAAKASVKDRAGSKHPTVKPLALMRYLVKLVTPPNGLILDPFAGSGTTLQAAIENGFHPTGVEADEMHFADIKARLAAMSE